MIKNHKYQHQSIGKLLEKLIEESADCPARKHGDFNTALVLLKNDLNSWGKINNQDLITSPADYSINERDFCLLFTTLQKYYKFAEKKLETMEVFSLKYDRMIFEIKNSQQTIFSVSKLP